VFSVFVRVLSAFCADRHINGREREKERNVEEENTIRLLADWLAIWMATRRRRGRKEASTDYSCFSLSLSLFFLKQRLYTNEPGRREHEKARLLISRIEHIHVYILRRNY
jgi:hypothetical protein